MGIFDKSNYIANTGINEQVWESIRVVDDWHWLFEVQWYTVTVLVSAVAPSEDIVQP